MASGESIDSHGRSDACNSTTRSNGRPGIRVRTRSPTAEDAPRLSSASRHRYTSIFALCFRTSVPSVLRQFARSRSSLPSRTTRARDRRGDGLTRSAARCSWLCAGSQRRPLDVPRSPLSRRPQMPRRRSHQSQAQRGVRTAASQSRCRREQREWSPATHGAGGVTRSSPLLASNRVGRAPAPSTGSRCCGRGGRQTRLERRKPRAGQTDDQRRTTTQERAHSRTQEHRCTNVCPMVSELARPSLWRLRLELLRGALSRERPPPRSPDKRHCTETGR